MRENKLSEKTLVIAEKPSVALDLTRALKGKFKKEKNYYESDSYVVSYAIGHLVTICDPKEMDEKYKEWSLSLLPILPQNYELKPIGASKAQLSALGKLIRRKDIGHIINACDAGREGELIFRYIMQYIGKSREVKKPLSRLWLQSMTLDSIKKAFESLRSDAEMQNLTDAALCRSEADWLIGINGSRALTSYNSQFGGFHLTPCGRVQTPTLSLMVQRENERNNFVSKDYWQVYGNFTSAKTSYSGRWFDPQFNKNSQDPHATADRVWNEAAALKIKEICTGQTGTVEENSKPSSQKSPLLYDLTSLQREANGRFGFSAKRTLQLAQSLYERYKLTTYPRTDSRCLPEDYIPTVHTTLGALSLTPFAKHAQTILTNDWVKPDKKIFNNAKISDHFAIVPTGNLAAELPEAEAKLFAMITQRFLAVFFPPALYLNTTRITIVKDHYFKTEGKVLKDAGWRAVYGKSEEDEDKILDSLEGSTEAKAKSISVEGDVTRPPARYTEATLLSAMEGAGKLVDDEELSEALKERGIGTPATRAAVIEKLIADKYLVREGREMIPTSKAFDLMNLINAMDIETLKSPELTGDWEQKLGLIEKGQYTRLRFMSETEDLTRSIIDRIKGFDEKQTRKVASFSPINGKVFYESVSRFEAEDGSFMIRKMLGGRNMSDAEVAELLTNRKIGPLTGFRSKRGSSFTAVIILNDKDRVEFVFEDDTSSPSGEAFEIEKETPIGNSPIDNSPVYETLTGYLSKSMIDQEPTGLRISKTILGKEIGLENIKLMLSGEKTELITGFKSSKTHRLFDAYLKLSSKGKIEFEFPPRKPSARTKKSA
jgi:DNA topoisomerase-3